MPTRIRLQRHGRKQRPYYFIVVADSRAKRDGKYIERIGAYNPNTNPATIELDNEKAFQWVMKGAQPSDTVRAILKYRGIMYRKHLQRGVRKGAFDQEQADKLFQEWLDAQDQKITSRAEDLKKKVEAERDARYAEEAKKRAEREAAEAAALKEEEAEATEAEEASSEEAPVEAAEVPAQEENTEEAAPATEEVKEEAKEENAEESEEKKDA